MIIKFGYFSEDHSEFLGPYGNDFFKRNEDIAKSY
jgi:hypothetical protein